MTELGQQRLDVQVIGASKSAVISDTQRPLVLMERMRAADLVVALVSPGSVNAKPMVEELSYALSAGTPVVGVLVGGATMRSGLPKGIDRGRLYGWDWGTLKRAFR